MYIRSLALPLLAPLFLAACEKPFEALVPSDLAFSIYGSLDAAADTHWVRVMPIRQTLASPLGPIDAVVTLEELETGATVEMSDSISRYLPAFGGDDQYLHNFSTTMPVVPGRHYRLTATRSDGATASATVLIPVFEPATLELTNAFSLPNSTSNAMSLTFGTISGSPHLAMVLGREDIPESCNWSHPIHQEYLPINQPAPAGGDDHGVQLSWPLEGGAMRPSYVPPRPAGCPHLGPKRVLAVAAGEPWPHNPNANIRELTHTASVNNVEGGVGFLAGVQTHVFPFAGCTPFERARPCTITFSPRSATLVGTVLNGCTDGPLQAVRVRLLAPPTNALRFDTTDVSGAFQFQGLDPDVAHSLTLAQLVAPGDFIPLDVENVSLAEGAVDTISIEMTHRRDCRP